MCDYITEHPKGAFLMSRVANIEPVRMPVNRGGGFVNVTHVNVYLKCGAYLELECDYKTFLGNWKNYVDSLSNS